MKRGRHHHHHHPQISLLVPFRASTSSAHRKRVWKWLEKYWEYELPDAEIVIGHSCTKAFSKTEAVNNAARRAHGRIFVILDADAYIRGSVILDCARGIDEARRRGHRRWYIPYRHLFRLTKAATELVLESEPRHPHRFTSPPAVDEVESTLGSMHGHHYGAMIQIMPREAFELVGGMDSRFVGWGGEDVAFVRALDTLYAKHKTWPSDVLHLWHESIGRTIEDRMWEGQKTPGVNGDLAHRYHLATGDRARMRKLVDDGHAYSCGRRDWLSVFKLFMRLIRWCRRLTGK